MTLHPDFTKLVVDALPAEVRELLISQGPGIMVAGGFVRDTLVARKPKDVDLFAVNAEEEDKAAFVFEFLAQNSIDYTRKNSFNAVTFDHCGGGLPVQFITRAYTPDHMNTLLSADFTINQAGVYYEGGEWHGIASEGFLDDFPKFEMRVGAIDRTCPLRVLKFVAAGWTISSDEYAKVIARFIHSEPLFGATRLGGGTPLGEDGIWAVVKHRFSQSNYSAPVVPDEDVPF